MTDIASVPTPSALIELPVLHRNIARVAAAAAANDVELRPHAKTHKSVEIARRQVDAGAAGITVAKLSEAEVFADGGIDDLFVCYPIVGRDKLERLMSLAGRVRLCTIVESAEQARVLSSAAREAGVELEVTVDVDTGLGRIGVTVDEIDGLVEVVRGLPALRLRGISTHEGFVYALPDIAERTRTVLERLQPFVDAGRRLDLDTISTGATPSIFETIGLDGVTECRPGNYVFYDAMQVALGAAQREDCALTVLATVVSVRAGGRAIVDAGSKALSSDAGAHGLSLLTGYGEAVDRPGIRVTGLSEEHGWLTCDEQAGEVKVGDRLRILPNHACATISNFARAFAVEGDDVTGEIEVSARGALT